MPKSFRDILKGAALLSLGQVASYGLSFARNLILARLLTKADFGLAAALSMTMSLLELVSRMAFGKQIIQAREGEDPLFQAVAHAVQMAVGVISALLVIAVAYPTACVLEIPELTWAFMLLALVPLARASMHLDIARMQRSFIFSPTVLCELVPQALFTLAAWPLALYLSDFRAVLWIMIGKETLTVAMSHMLAKRPYRWSWHQKHVKQMLAFGWPLLLNGFMMFASQQGDQMLIGAAFSLADLGSYAIAFTLTSIPFLIFGQVLSSLMLPALSRYQEDPLRLERHYCRYLEISVIGALFLLGPIVVAGDPIVRLLYGDKYSGIGMLMTLFGAMVALKFFRLAPTVAAMACADTINQFFSNFARAVSLPLAVLVVALCRDNMEAVAACGLIGEMAAIIISVLRVWKRQNIDLSVHVRPMLFLLGWIVVGLFLHYWLGGENTIWLASVRILILWSVGAVISILLFPDLMGLYRKSVTGIRIPIGNWRR